ncbi:hypothetical protein [Bradyrhizobium sp. USDA 3315]
MIVVPAGVKVYLTLGRTDMPNGLAIQRNSPRERLNASFNSQQAREIGDMGSRFRRQRTARKMSLVTRWSPHGRCKRARHATSVAKAQVDALYQPDRPTIGTGI